MAKKTMSIGDHWRAALFLVIFIPVVIIIIIALAVSLPTVITNSEVNKILANLPPEQREYFEAWRTQPLTFPEDIMDVEPFTTSTVVAARNFREQLKLHGDRANSLGLRVELLFFEQGSTTELAALAQELEELTPLLEAFEKLVMQPDYEIEALTAGYNPAADGFDQGSPDLPFPNLAALQLMPKLMEVRILQLMEDGGSTEALANIETILKATRTSIYSGILKKLISNLIRTTNAEFIHELISKNTDYVFLHQILKLLNEMDPQQNCSYHIPHPSFDHLDVALEVTDHLGSIRYAKRFGIERQVQGLTAQEIVAESLMGVGSDYAERFILPAVADETVKGQIRQEIKGNRNALAVLRGEMAPEETHANKVMVPAIVSADFYANHQWPSFDEINLRDNMAQSKYDLLRLTIALKIYKLEQGEEPTDLSLLAPDLLPLIPLDPFTDALPYRMKPFFYAVGPDGIDQQGALRYDPTNGAFSAGDVMLKK